MRLIFLNSFPLQFDYRVCSMLILITTISSIVIFLYNSYINGDPHMPRFMSCLSCIYFFMIILVTSII